MESASHLADRSFQFYCLVRACLGDAGSLYENHLTCFDDALLRSKARRAVRPVLDDCSSWPVGIARGRGWHGALSAAGNLPFLCQKSDREGVRQSIPTPRREPIWTARCASENPDGLERSVDRRIQTPNLCAAAPSIRVRYCGVLVDLGYTETEAAFGATRIASRTDSIGISKAARVGSQGAQEKMRSARGRPCARGMLSGVQPLVQGTRNGYR